MAVSSCLNIHQFIFKCAAGQTESYSQVLYFLQRESEWLPDEMPCRYNFLKIRKTRDDFFSCIWLIVLTNRSLCCMSSTSSQASFRSGKWVKSPSFSCAVYSPSFILKLSTQPNRSSTCFPSPWSCRFSLFRRAVMAARKATFVFHSLSLKTGNRPPSLSLRKWTISGSTARKRCKTFPRLSHLTSLCRMRSP